VTCCMASWCDKTERQQETDTVESHMCYLYCREHNVRNLRLGLGLGLGLGSGLGLGLAHREESAFIAVAPTIRLPVPRAMILINSAALLQSCLAVWNMKESQVVTECMVNGRPRML
jgi:hypothetical protein